MSDGTASSRLAAALADRYRIERPLGEGGMATVYLAEDLKHDRRVALKVLRLELAAVVGAERFLAEIRTTANLQHPHILPLFDSGQAEGFLFYVMPYVEGETLQLGTMGYLQGESMDRRFFHTLGASKLDRTICYTAGGAGMRMTVGANIGADAESIPECDLILLWGTNTLTANPHLWPFVLCARENGAPVICSDPIRTRTAQQCDEWIPIRPGTDAAASSGHRRCGGRSSRPTVTTPTRPRASGRKICVAVPPSTTTRSTSAGSMNARARPGDRIP